MSVTPDPRGVVITLDERSLPHVREMFRQQLLGDEELLRDALAGREDPEIRMMVADRIRVIRSLGDQLGVPKNPERRRRSRSDPKFQVPAGVLPTTLLMVVIALITGIAVGCDVVAGHALGAAALFAPVVALTALRYGALAGYLASAGCVVLITVTAGALDVSDLQLRAPLLFASLALVAWITRRERFSGLVRRRTD